MWVRRAALSIVVPVLLLLAWFWVHAQQGTQSSYITDPREVLRKAWLLRGTLGENSILSLWRLAFGMVIGAVAGVGTGILLGRQKLARRLFGPTLSVVAAIPVIVLIPFFLMIFGFGELFRIAVVAAVVQMLVHQAVFNSVRFFPAAWLELAAHREKTGWQVVKEMLIPSALPEIVRAVRLSLLLAWLAIAIGEKAVAEWPNGGLGYQIMRARELGKYEELFAAVLVLGAIAWVADSMLGWLERVVSHWRGVPAENL